MKVCLLCGETYGDPIDFCFRDGEVLASAETRQTPARARSESFTATPGLVTAAAVVEGDDPDVTRANRRALMRAAAAAYLVTDPSSTGGTHTIMDDVDDVDVENGAHSDNGAGNIPAPAPLVVSPLDQGMADLPWPLEEEVVEEPARGSMFAAGLIGALVVVAAALGAGLLVLVGLGQRAADVQPNATLEASRSAVPRSAVRDDAYEAAPTPRPLATGRTSQGSVVVQSGAEPVPPDVAPEAGASDFLVVMGDEGGSGPLVLYVDGVRAGVVPVTVSLTPGEHTFRLTTEASGSAMLEVRRIVERPSDPAGSRTINLAE